MGTQTAVSRDVQSTGNEKGHEKGAVGLRTAAAQLGHGVRHIVGVVVVVVFVAVKTVTELHIMSC